MTRSGSMPQNQLMTAAHALSPIRGRQPTIDQRAVIAAALHVVDNEGLGALTMRRLAEDLGVGIATIYAAAGSKEEVLNGLVEEILMRVPEVEAHPEDWEAGLVELFVAIHELFVRHPAVAHLGLLRRITGPMALGTQETILKLLRASGMDERTIASAYVSLTSFIMGFTMMRISRMEDGLKHAGPSRGFSSEGFPEVTAFASKLANHASTDGFLNGLRRLIGSFQLGTGAT